MYLLWVFYWISKNVSCFVMYWKFAFCLLCIKPMKSELLSIEFNGLFELMCHLQTAYLLRFVDLFFVVVDGVVVVIDVHWLCKIVACFQWQWIQNLPFVSTCVSIYRIHNDNDFQCVCVFLCLWKMIRVVAICFQMSFKLKRFIQAKILSLSRWSKNLMSKRKDQYSRTPSKRHTLSSKPAN